MIIAYIAMFCNNYLHSTIRCDILLQNIVKEKQIMKNVQEIKILVTLLSVILILCACTGADVPSVSEASSEISAEVSVESSAAESDVSSEISEEISQPSEDEIAAQYIENIVKNLDGKSLKRNADEDFAEYLYKTYGLDKLQQLEQAVSGEYKDSIWKSIFGSSLLVLHDEYTGESSNSTYFDCTDKNDIVISFTGDFCLSDDWPIMEYFHAVGDDVTKLITDETAQYLKSADILMVNNEFCISDRGEKMPWKYYTFRSALSNLKIFEHIGVDIVSLANNHVFDYQADAFYDTLSNLDASGYLRVGAGANAAEAQAPIYVVANGIKIAIISASSAEKFVLTPEAGEDTPGVAYMYDETQFVENSAKAAMNADFVIAYVHWGTEDSDQINDNQRSVARKLVDVGVDCIIGAHPHVLQGTEFMDGKPIIYSLGDFVFDSVATKTAVYTLTIHDDLTTDSVFIPCYEMADDHRTGIVHGDTAERFLDYMTRLSPNVSFDSDGRMSERQ